MKFYFVLLVGLIFVLNVECIADENLNTVVTPELRNSKCLHDFSSLFDVTNARSGLTLANLARRASGKLGSGTLNCSKYAFGDYDACLNVEDNVLHYCVVPVTLVTQSANMHHPLAVHVQYQLGLCVPPSCTESEDFKNLLEEHKFVFTFPIEKHQELRIEESKILCRNSKNISYTFETKVALLVCVLFFALAILATTLDLLLYYTGMLLVKDQGLTYCWRHLIHAFSLLNNTYAILTTKQPPSAISCLNGIRVLSMFWIILCHAHVWYTMFKPINNQLLLERDVFPRFWYQVILNGYFSVDSFFLLSGTLNAYNNFQGRERRSRNSFPFFRYYIHRYLRLTPVYAFVLLFRHLIVYFADGPMSIQLSTGPETQNYQNCDHYCWTNLLYINTIHPWKMRDMCMSWTWSLANDMQFHAIAPLILIPMHASIRKGLAITGTVLLASLIATAMIVGIYGFSPVSALQPFAYDGSDQTDAVYIKSYCRISPYLIGLVLGYILHHRIRLQLIRPVKFLCYTAMWVTAMATSSAIIFGLYHTWFGYKMSMTENIAYYTFSH